MSSPKILITGATGFLGSSVALCLLRGNPEVDLLLLVRAATSNEGLQRIRAALEVLEAEPVILAGLNENQILLGTFAKVSEFSDDNRLNAVTHVINCAAVASFGNNPQIWPINVEGTFEFAKRMAESPRLHRFLHVGTAMACGPDAKSPVHESWQFAPVESHLVAYTASKAAIELKIKQELPDFPIVVARPSIVVGHTQLGCKPSGSIFWVFRMAHKLGYFTCDLDEKIDVIPVDYCAAALVQLALKPKLAHDLYHISAGEGSSCSFAEIDTTMAKSLNIEPVANRYRKVNGADLAHHAKDFQEILGPCNRRLVLRALRLYGGFAELNFVFDNARLLAEEIPPSPKLTDYIGVCALTSEAITIADQMAWDFK